jgi:hypothetical protein
MEKSFMVRLTLAMCVLASFLSVAGLVALLVMRYNGMPGDVFLDLIALALIPCAAGFGYVAGIHLRYPHTISVVASNLFGGAAY